MMNLLEMMQNRRSIRKYTEEPIAKEKLEQVLQAGLLSESGHGARPWQLIVVQDPDMLKKMASCREGSAKMLEGADAAIVVVADTSLTDVWVEDCSIVMANMHLMADSLGLGSCWIQGRLRTAENGQTTEAYLRELLGFPEDCALEAILSLGMPQRHPSRRELADLPTDKLHWGTF